MNVKNLGNKKVTRDALATGYLFVSKYMLTTYCFSSATAGLSIEVQ